MNKMLIQQTQSLTEGMHNWVTNFANVAALLKQVNSQVDWAGFYLVQPKKQKLILGPYQGTLACNLIPFGQGVCGKVAQTKQTQLVPDVDKYPGHIACDSASRSEIVVPLIKKSKLLGVLDLDSNQLNAFTFRDQSILEKLSQVLIQNSNLNQ